MSEKIQLNLFDVPRASNTDLPSQDELWDMWINSELTIEQWAQVTNYLYPLSPQELDRLSPRHNQSEERINA